MQNNSMTLSNNIEVEVFKIIPKRIWKNLYTTG